MTQHFQNRGKPFPYACQIAAFMVVSIVIELLSGYAFVAAWAADVFVTKADDPKEYWDSIVLHSILAIGLSGACIAIKWWKSKSSVGANAP